MSTIYFAGGEDVDFYQVGGGQITTNGTFFRGTYARCALLCNVSNHSYWQNWVQYSATTFYTGVRIFTTELNTVSGYQILSWGDSSNIERLRIAGTGTTSIFKVEKVDSGGSATQLGSNFSMILSANQVDKIDVYMYYNASGTFTVWLNGIQQFTYSGDVTTNSVSALATIRVGNHNPLGVGFSEVILSDTDTRSMNLQTLQPVVNGNTHTFDTGSPAAANVNEIILNDSTLDGSTTANQVDQYTIPVIASGTYTIMGIGVSARLQKGSSGPSKMDLGVRSGGSDYWSSDQVLTTAWAGYQNWWNVDPNSSATWASLPANIGIKSIT